MPDSRTPAGPLVALAAAALLASCGGEPDGALLEIHASYDPGVGDGIADFESLRTLRVRLQREEVDETREVEQRGPPPDVFVIRSPLTTPPSAGDVTLGVRAIRFTGDGEQIVGCIQQTDLVVIDEAVNLVEVTLMPGECP